MHWHRALAAQLVIGFLCSLGAASSDDPRASAVSFRTVIQPLFAKNCYACHGPDKQRGGLRLDRRDAALRGGDDGPVFVAGKPQESQLFHLVAGSSEDGRKMPPKGPALAAAEVELIRRWIEQGADWPRDEGAPARSQHWAFQPIRRPNPPQVHGQKWVRNPIDAFILEKLEAERIAPAPEADAHTLLRRLYLDLTGFPPDASAMEQYLKEPTPEAYERLVDQLLASPHYGEQWARHWLDLARYADSDGYEKDLYRPHAWRWRDWVIEALNQDLPYDQFTLQQIAGDLLPGASATERLATGFHRNTLLNREGGVDLEEDRVQTVVDRVSTVGTTWLGLTVGCAECHSHKYDPISQREFYQLYDFFNSTDDRDELLPPTRLQAKVEQANALFQQVQERVVRQLRDSELEPAFTAWLREVAELPAIWTLPDRYELPTFGANNGANLYPQEDGSFLVTGTVGGNTHYIMMSDLRLDGITAIRIEALTDSMLPRLGPGWAANGNFVLSELRVEAAPLADVTNLRAYPVASAVADHGQAGFEIERAIDGNEKTGWAVDLPHLPIHAVDRAAIFQLKEPIQLGTPLRLKVSLVQHHGGSHTLGRLRVSYTNQPAPEGQAVPQTIRDLAARPFAQLSLADQCQLIHYWLATHHPQSPLVRIYAESLAHWLKAQGNVRGQMLAERREPRPTHIHIRGNFLHPGEKVAAGFPAVLAWNEDTADQVAASRPAHAATALPVRRSRLDLAHWLIDERNPLTARVAVNRIWKHLFGEGLVPSVADFGTQGDPPSHAELLDWLASEFMAKRWSQKELIRLIVTSSTYRQSSKVRPELSERDAYNRWLARQNRFRLSAENVRDQVLAAGGTLDRTIGGPSVPTATARRGLYVQFKRSTPVALLITFDAPAGTTTCPKRERSNTPLQALSLLNDDLYVSAARRLATRTLQAAPPSATGRLNWLFRQALTRPPQPTELVLLTSLYHEAALEFQENPAAAEALVGKLPNASDHATWTVVARAVLNLDEMVVRE